MCKRSVPGLRCQLDCIMLLLENVAVIPHLYGESPLWGDEIHPLMPDVTKTETMR